MLPEDPMTITIPCLHKNPSSISRSQVGDFFGRKWRLVTVLVVVRNATDFATSSTIGAHHDPDGQ